MGDCGPLFLGHTLQVLHDPIALSRERLERYGPLSWCRLMGRRVVVIQSPQAAQAVLVNNAQSFALGPAWGFFIGPFFERGLVLLDFAEHLPHRRVIQQAFTRQRLNAYLPLVHHGARRGIGSWHEGPLRVLPSVKQLTLDMAIDIFLGLNLSPGQTRKVTHALTDLVRAGLSVVRFPVPGLRWHRGLKARAVMEEFFRHYIPTKRAEGGDDLFAVLCGARSEHGEQFTDADLVNHMIFVLVAAHDTTTVALTSMLYYLARHPHWQQRCRAESLALAAEQPALDDLPHLQTLDLVMRESLRLCPPIPRLPRMAVRDSEILRHYIPAGTLVVVDSLSNHLNPQHWPGPEDFDPGRFITHHSVHPGHPYAWAPFGSGAHKCIGLHFASLQIKAIMHELLRTFTWTVPPDYIWELDMTTLPAPRDGLPVTLRRV